MNFVFEVDSPLLGLSGECSRAETRQSWQLTTAKWFYHLWFTANVEQAAVNKVLVTDIYGVNAQASPARDWRNPG